MENLVLEVNKRSDNELKKNASRRLRRDGFIPAVMYGLDLEPVSIKVSEKEFKDLLKGRSAANLIFDMVINENGNRKKETVILKDIQRDPISREFLHLDFLRIQMEKEVETLVPIIIINEEESIGVKEEGGVIQHGLRELHISCLPKDIPEKIEYDVANLKLGESVRVSDIKAPENIKVLSHPEEVVVSIIHPTQLREEKEVIEEEITEEEEPELVGKEKEEDKKQAEEKKTPEE